ncbi:MAG: efflux RND transporter periplasmic adaptor subunit [Dehalococcoidia bacterium]|nr:efflux RND transporter periplasmic adaptor subunit [Dehalococcoidia bacterium]
MKLGRNRMLVAGVFAAVVAAGTFAYVQANAKPEQGPAPVEAQVTRGDLRLTVTASGALKPIAAKSADLSFRSSGVVEEVYVQVGDQVIKGQALARLELRPLQTQVQQAEIALRTAQLNLQGLQQAARPEDVVTAQASLESARARFALMVQQGLPNDVASAEASTTSARAKLDQLTNPNASDLLSAEASVESAKASVASAQQKLNLLQNPTVADVASATSAVEAARQKLETLKNPTAADLASAQATVASAISSFSNATTALDNLRNPLPDTLASARSAVLSAESSLNNALSALTKLTGTVDTAKRQALLDLYLKLSDARTTYEYKTATNAPDAEITAARAEYERMLRRIADLEATTDLPNAGVTATDIKAAKASIANAQANLEIQKIKLDKVIKPYPSDLVAAEATAAAAKASLESAKAKLHLLQRPNSADLAVAQANFDAANAKYNQLLNPTADDLNNARFSVSTAQANLQTAEARLGQLRNPNPSDVASASASVSQAEANLEKARTPYKESDLVSQQSSLVQAEASLVKTMQPGAPLDIAKSQLSVERSQLDLDNAKFNLEQATLSSPISGIVSKVAINPGASQGVGASTVVISVLDLSEMQVDVNIDETDIAKVDLRQPVLLTVEATRAESYRGTVIAIAPQSTVTSGVTSYLVSVAVSEPRGLRAGMTANVNVVYQNKQAVVLVPNRALRTVNRERQVTVLVDGKPEVRTVQVGLADDQRTEVNQGLAEGDTVLILPAATRTATGNALAPGAGAVAIPGAAIGGGANFRAPAGR